MSTMTVSEMAKQQGIGMASEYRKECGVDPDRGTIGDWDSLAWANAWANIKTDDSTDGDYEEALQVWRGAFFED